MKSEFFFRLVQSSTKLVVTSGSTKLLKALEIITNIACNVISEAILKGIDGINDEDDE